jgi:asparagine synthetase B (glutamine-hydrolysing)
VREGAGTSCAPEVVVKLGRDAVSVKLAQRPGGLRTGRRRTTTSWWRRPRRPSQVRVPPCSARWRTTNRERRPRLAAALDRHERLAIVVSGGVDSMTLAHVATRHSNVRATMYHAVSRRCLSAQRARGSACGTRGTS